MQKRLSLWQTAYGDLSDANGNTLTAMDESGIRVAEENFLWAWTAMLLASFPAGLFLSFARPFAS